MIKIPRYYVVFIFWGWSYFPKFRWKIDSSLKSLILFSPQTHFAVKKKQKFGRTQHIETETEKSEFFIFCFNAEDESIVGIKS